MRYIRSTIYIIAAIGVIVAAYFIYAYTAYYRLPDKMQLQITDNPSNKVNAEQVISLMTYNIGYGSYPPSYTFFLDGGTEVIARSNASVLEMIAGSTETIKQFNPDIVLLQEVDIQGRRSHSINQVELFGKYFPDYSKVAAVNYDSPFIFYPLTDPIGKNKSSIMTMTRYSVSEASRRSLAVATDFNKFFDLDRCYSVSVLEVSNGKKLYIYNLHLTAFGGSPTIRDAQIRTLADDMHQKIQAGDYVICGGDFNHDILQNSIQYFNGAQINLEWAQPFPQDMLPPSMRLCSEYSSGTMVPTVRNLDKPYIKGQSTVLIIDGFFISSNIQCLSVENLDREFKYSDHNPVLLKVKLLN